ncbi:hypothetical protein HK096_002581 [Nowakowskiella sp. JEL0078]|nr:hypothetical protein HK096_002581 [Nowakowskiella sp. JEL0078]
MELSGFRHPANILYILGNLPVSEGIVAITAPLSSDYQNIDLWRINVFIPKLSTREAVFLGSIPTPEEIKKNYIVDEVFSVSDFQKFIKGKLAYSTVEPDELPSNIPSNLDIYFDEGVEQAFFEARFHKTEEELELLKFSSQLSAWAHSKVASRIEQEPEISEIVLASYFTQLTATCGCHLQAYPPIVGVGKSSGVLHFRTGENETEGYEKITTPNFVLIDAAGEYHGYASDITRTLARKGEWTPQMREIYDMVETAQTAALSAFGFGISWEFVKWVSAYTLTRELLNAGFLQGGNVFELLYFDAWRVFMPHGLGHSVGLDVHDPTPKKLTSIQWSEKMTSKEAAEKHILPPIPQWVLNHMSNKVDLFDYSIGYGQIVTIEPGVYFIPSWFEYIKSLGTSGPGAYVNWKKVEEYVDIGGVRIEDIVVINYDGEKEIISRL